MRKRRYIILFIFFIIVAVVIGVWQIIQPDQMLVTFIIEKAQQKLNAHISVAEARLEPSAVHLSGIHIQAENGSYTVDIETVELKYSWVDIVRVLKERTIYFDRLSIQSPQAQINLTRLSSSDSTASHTKTGSDKPFDLTQIQRYLPHGTFVLLNGDVTFLGPNDLNYSLDKLQLHLQSASDLTTTLQASAAFASNITNFHLEGSGHPANFLVETTLVDIPIRAFPTSLLTDDIQILDGIASLKAQGQLIYQDETPQVDYLARLEIEHGAVMHQKLKKPVSDIELGLLLENGRVVTQTLNAHIGQAQFAATADVDFNKREISDVRVNLQDFKPEAILEIDHDLFGITTGDGFDVVAQGHGPFADPTISGAILNSHLQRRQIQMHDVQCYFVFENQQFVLDQLSFDVVGGHVFASGFLDGPDWLSPTGEFQIQSDDLDLNQIVQDERVEGLLGFDFKVSGTLQDPEVTGQLSARDLNLGGVHFPLLECSAHYRDHRVDIRFGDTQNRLNIITTLDQMTRNPVVDATISLSATSLSKIYQKLRPDEKPKEIPGSLSGELHLTGELQKPVFTGGVHVNDNDYLTGSVLIEGRAAIPDSLDLRVYTDSMRVLGAAYEMGLHVSGDRHGLTLHHLGDGDHLVGHGYVALDTTRAMDAHFEFNDVNIGEIADFFPTTSYLPEDTKGLLSGRFSIFGQRDNPEASFSMRLRDGVYRDVQNLSVDIDAIYSDHSLYLNQLAVEQKQQKILKIAGFHRPAGSYVHLQAHQFDARLLPALIGKPMKLSGILDFDVHYRNSGNTPQLVGDISARDGHLDVMTYTHLSGQIYGNSNGVYAQDLRLFGNTNYVVNIDGRLPFELPEDGGFKVNRKLDLAVEVEGNIPSLLPRLASKEIAFATGFGKAFVRVVGGLDEVLIKQGFAEFIECVVHPTLLVNEIKHINGYMVIQNNEITIRQAEGTILEARLQIESTHNPDIDFPHFELAGLDWGVLQFTTPDEGVSINIPKLILERERGKFWVEGNSHSTGLFGGSLSWPYLDATFIIDDVNITWPSLDADPVPRKKYGKPGFAAAATWNVIVRPKRNVWYINDFAILLVDETSELWFKGSYADSSLMIGGMISAKIGTFEYLQEEFEAENVVVKFNPYEVYPYVYGRAVRKFEQGSQVYLEIYSYDPITGEEKEGGQFYNLKFKLRSDRPSDDTFQEILSRLHHDVNYESLSDEQRMEQNREEAVSALGYQVGKMMLRPVLRTFEETLRRTFQLDFVTFRPGLLENLFDEMQSDETDVPLSASTILLNRSRMSLGKYLRDRWYINYILTVERDDPRIYIAEDRIGLKQEFFLEYYLPGNTKLKYWYHYNPVRNNRWQKIGFEKTFHF